MQTKQKLFSAAALLACSCMSTQAHATLATNAVLQIDPFILGGYTGTVVVGGSYFAMDTDGDGDISQPEQERTGLTHNNGLFINATQSASGTHAGAPNGTESPGIDAPWNFFGNTGLHQTTSAVAILTDDGSGNVTLDLSGWTVSWNGIDIIPMDAGAWEPGFTNSVAQVVCAADCANGDTYALDYSATVPNGDPSGFGNVTYHLHLVGTIFVPNTPPTAIADTININAGGTTTINVTNNGSDDPDGDNAQLKVATFVQGLNGTATGVGTDTISYTNNLNTASSDSFTYTVTDGTDESAAATVTVNINAFPIATDDPANTIGGGTVDIVVLANDSDPDGIATIDVTSVTITGNPTNGTAVPNATTGVVTYTNDGTLGSDNFTYTIADNNGATSITSATVTIDVQADPPPSCSGTTSSLDQDTSTVFVVSNFTSPGSGKTLDFTTVATPDLPLNGDLVINPVTGDITYVPDPGYVGADSYSYTIDDDTKTCVPATVTLDVLSTNSAPVAVDDNNTNLTTTSVNTALNIDVKANDTDDDNLANSTVSITNTPVNGGANVETDGTVTYTPAAGYSGTDSFTYNLTDAGSLQSSNATVSIIVNADTPSTESGTLTPGDIATSVASNDGRVTAADIGVVDNGSSDNQGILESCIGGCFDFKVTGFNGDAQVVLPLSIAIPTPTDGNTLLYRKLISTGWVNFDTSGNNAIHTAPGSGTGNSTICPTASDTIYDVSPGLTTGDRCIRLTIVDNGPNDNDATVGAVADPSGIAESFNIDTRVSSTDGCSMSGNTVDSSQRADWWLVAAFVGLLGLIRLKQSKA